MRIAARVIGTAAGAMLAACAPQLQSTVGSPGPVGVTQRMPVDPVGIRPIPQIPVALRGCWQSQPPEDPEEPGAADRIIVTATTIEQYGIGDQPDVATAEFVERVGARMIEGRFSAPDSNGGLKTIATSLILGDGGEFPAGMLRRQEGDAGSVFYDRCE